MNIRKLLPVFVAAIALAAAASVHPVNAVGLLYINPLQQGPFPAETPVAFAVKVASIDPFNGWDILVQTDPAAINPSSFTITPNLLAANFTSLVLELIHCVNGAGTGCTLSDGPGIVHSSAVALGPPPQTGPSSGLLFNITYTAGTATFSTVHILSEIISNGTPTPVTVTVQDAVYGLPPDFNIAAIPASPSSIPVGSSATSTITLTSLNGLAGAVSLSAVSSPTGLTPSFSAPSVTLTTDGTGMSTLTITAPTGTAPGTYTVTVTGTSGALVHSATVTITVTVFDYAVSVSPISDTANLGSSTTPITKTATVTVTLMSGPAQVVTLTTTVSGPSNLVTASLASNTVTPTGITTLTVMVPQTAALGTYTVTITGSPTDPTPLDNVATYSLTVVALPATTTSITCSPNTPFTNQAASCTVTVTDTSNAPTTPIGSISLSTNSTGTFSANTCYLAAGSTAGTANCSTSYTPSVPGGHEISAAYSGDSSHAPSSGTLVITVGPATTTASVICSPSTVVISQQSTCTATVTDNTSYPTTPTGTVSFTSNSASGQFSPAASCTLSPGSTAGTSSCSVNYTPLVAGSQTITDTYNGDLTHGASVDSKDLTVNLRSTTTEIACVPSTVIVDTASSCTVTARDASSPGAITSPTGTVTFALGGASTVSGSFSASSCALLASSTTATSSCSVNFTPSSPGAATIVATYRGDGNHSGSSGSASLTANQVRTPTVTVTCSSPVPVDSSTTCTATVTGGVPTGGITFTSISATGHFSPSTCALSNGACSVTYTDTRAGTVTITASYTGDVNNLPGTGTFTLTVSSPASTIFGLQPYIFYGIVGVIVAAISTIGGIVVGRARRKPPRQPPSKSRSGD